MLIAVVALLAAFELHEKGRDIDFRYAWPSEACAIPSLARQLRSEQQRDRTRTAQDAAKDFAGSGQATYPFHQHSFERQVSFVGRSSTLASFTTVINSYTGGAHPNSATAALLWDVRAGRATSFAGLFLSSPTNLLKPGYCAELSRQRREKLGETPTGDMWPKCPDPLSLAVVPTDKDHNGRFERLEIVASPYEVGSYAEGYYSVTLPVTASLIKRLKPAYRASFEVQRQ